jgi:hypothetical protein
MNEVRAGTINLYRGVSAKAAVSTRINSKSISNEIDETDLQYEKHDEQRIGTWRRIVIDVREKQKKMHVIRCMPIPNLFQMKSMKIIRNI